MPGPNSAPNGDRSLVARVMVTHDGNGKQLAVPVRKREWLRIKGRLDTGKTALKKRK